MQQQSSSSRGEDENKKINCVHSPARWVGMAACQIRRKGGGGQRMGEQERGTEARTEIRGRRAEERKTPGWGGNRRETDKRRGEKSRNEMQNVLCLSRTALTLKCSLFPPLPISSQSPCRTMWICLSLSPTEGSPHLSGGYQDGYTLLITELSTILPYARTCQDLKEQRLGCGAVDFLYVCRDAQSYGFNRGLDV